MLKKATSALMLGCCYYLCTVMDVQCFRRQTGVLREWSQPCLRPGWPWTTRPARPTSSQHQPRAHIIMRGSNLGQLEQFAATNAEDMSWALDRVSPESFANRGLYVDTPVVLASGFLLLLLLALSFQRILGLDKFIVEFMLQQQEKRRQTITDARQKLERSWNTDEKSPDSDSS